jgi:hypothetical protein
VALSYNHIKYSTALRVHQPIIRSLRYTGDLGAMRGVCQVPLVGRRCALLLFLLVPLLLAPCICSSPSPSTQPGSREPGAPDHWLVLDEAARLLGTKLGGGLEICPSSISTRPGSSQPATGAQVTRRAADSLRAAGVDKADTSNARRVHCQRTD